MMAMAAGARRDEALADGVRTADFDDVLDAASIGQREHRFAVIGAQGLQPHQLSPRWKR